MFILRELLFFPNRLKNFFNFFFKNVNKISKKMYYV